MYTSNCILLDRPDRIRQTAAAEAGRNHWGAAAAAAGAGGGGS